VGAAGAAAALMRMSQPAQVRAYVWHVSNSRKPCYTALLLLFTCQLHADYAKTPNHTGTEELDREPWATLEESTPDQHNDTTSAGARHADSPDPFHLDELLNGLRQGERCSLQQHVGDCQQRLPSAVFYTYFMPDVPAGRSYC
jgi:hypothetical protein